MTFAREFLNHRAALGLAPSTMILEKRHIAYFLDYLRARGLEDVRDISRAFIEDFRRHIAVYRAPGIKRGPDRSTIVKRLLTVQAFLTFLVDRKILLYHPFPQRIKKAPRRLPPGLLREGEMHLLLSRPDTKTKMGLRDRAILELLYSTGLRASEVLNLTIYDVDFKGRMLYVRRGKGGKDRVVPLGRLASYYLAKYLREVRPGWLPARAFEPALFMNRRRLRVARLSPIIDYYAKADFPGRTITPHTFRHCCATHMLRGGANIRIVQRLLGHSQITSTEVYTQVVSRDLKEAHGRSHPRGRAKPCKVIDYRACGSSPSPSPAGSSFHPPKFPRA